MDIVLVIVWNNFTHDKRVMNICSSLSSNDYEVSLVASKEQRGLPLYEKREYEINRIPLFSSFYSKKSNYTNLNLANSKNIKQLIKNNAIRKVFIAFLNWLSFNFGVLIIGIKKRPKLVYANDLDTLTVGYIIAKICNAKLIYDSHEIWLLSNKFKRSTKFRQRIWKFLEKKIIIKCNAVICTTEMRSKYLKNNYKKDIQVLHNFPHYQEVSKHNHFREEFKIAENEIILLYQGLIDEKRGVFSIAQVCKDIPGIVIVFMGMGKDMNQLSNYIIQNKLETKMFVKNAVPPNILLDYTSSADIGLQLLHNTDFNHYSTVSNKLVEYIMAGLAIIASDFPEIAKIVKSNNIGLLVDPDNPDELKKVIRQLVNQPILLKQFKDNSKLNRSKYVWEEEEKQLLQIVREIK